jgi:predicted ester cyclase
MEVQMSVEENKALIRRYLDAISGKPKTEEVMRLFVADETLIEHIRAAEAAFPLYRMDLEEMIAEGDMVGVRVRMRAEQRGPFMGMPPSGKEVDVPGFVTYRIADGKIVDHWLLADNMLMMQQLGVIPASA